MADRDLADERDYAWDDLDEYDDRPVFARTSLEIKPAPAPWYRTGPAMFALGAIGLAVVAIVVAAVLLVSRDSLGPGDVEPAAPSTSSSPSPIAPSPSASRTVPSTSPAATTSASSESPPPPPVSEPSSAPGSNGPEIGVTRTPVTRSPISVRPTQRPAFPHY